MKESENGFSIGEILSEAEGQSRSGGLAQTEPYIRSGGLSEVGTVEGASNEQILIQTEEGANS